MDTKKILALYDAGLTAEQIDAVINLDKPVQEPAGTPQTEEKKAPSNVPAPAVVEAEKPAQAPTAQAEPTVSKEFQELQRKYDQLLGMIQANNIYAVHRDDETENVTLNGIAAEIINP